MKKLLIIFLLPFFCSAQTLELPFSVRVLNPLPLNAYYFNESGAMYTNTAEIISEVSSGVRHIGQTFLVSPGVEYWFEEGVTNGDLAVKLGGGNFWPLSGTGTLTGAVTIDGNTNDITFDDITNLNISTNNGFNVSVSDEFNSGITFTAPDMYIALGGGLGYMELNSSGDIYLTGDDVRLLPSVTGGVSIASVDPPLGVKFYVLDEGVTNTNVRIDATTSTSPVLQFTENGSRTSGAFWDVSKSTGHSFILNNGADRFRITSAGVLQIVTAPTNDDTNTNILTRDGSGNIETRAASSFIPSLTSTQIAYGSGTNTVTSEAAFNYVAASNTMHVGNIISDEAGFFNIESAGSATINIETGGDATIQTPNGTGILALKSSTNTVFRPLGIETQTTGTPAAGIGTGIEFRSETGTGANYEGAYVDAVASNVSAGNEDFDLVFSNSSGGATPAEKFRITDQGFLIQTTLGKEATYTSGSITIDTNGFGESNYNLNLSAGGSTDNNGQSFNVSTGTGIANGRGGDIIFNPGLGAGSGRAGRVEINSGVNNNGSGLKHARITTGSVSGGSTALVTITWTTPFVDANYTANVSVVESTTSSLSMSVVHIESISSSAITVRVLNNAVGALTGTVHAIAIHD